MAELKNNSEFTVYVPSPDGAGSVPVYPGQPFPKGAVVTNPLVLGKDAASAVSEPDDDDEPDDGPPPQSGKGSGEAKWRAYATAQGHDVTDLSGRDEIIDYLDGEGVPVE